MDDVGRFLAGRPFRAPDAEQVVVQLEGEAQSPAEGTVAGDDLLVGGRQQRAGLDRGGDECGRLAPDHVEVEVDADELVGRAHRDIDVLALAQRQAGLVSTGASRRRTVLSGKPRSVRRWRAMRDRLNIVSPVLIACGTPVDRPQGGAVAALDVAVLDVVVDEREVVAELDGRGARAVPADGRL
jgi:hypothetical protein